MALPLEQQPGPFPRPGLRLVARHEVGAVRRSRRHRFAGGVLAVAFFLVGGIGTAGRLLHHDPPRAPVTVVVQEGDTLWSLAERWAPGADPRQTVEEIRVRNRLADHGLRVGQPLVVP